MTGAHRQPRVLAAGSPVSWADIRIERDTGEPALRGEVGEVGETCIRSRRPATLLLGYYKNEGATAEAMRRGWFHSGDRGRCDEDGYFTLLDRITDTIRRRGENISSYEIERIVDGHPAVDESAAPSRLSSARTR